MLSVCVSTQLLGGSGGMLPRNFFFEIWCSEMASGAILDLKHHLKSWFYSWHGNRNLIWFASTSMQILCSVVLGMHTKASQGFCFASRLDPIKCNAGHECVASALTICLFSGLHSSLLRSDHEVRVGTNLWWWCACILPTSEGSATPSQPKHWSGGRWVCQTCSAGLDMYNVCMHEKGASEGWEHVKSLALGPVFIITRFTVNTWWAIKSFTLWSKCEEIIILICRCWVQ